MCNQTGLKPALTSAQKPALRHVTTPARQGTSSSHVTLTEVLADAICTAVVIGYVKDISAKQRTEVTFEYHKSGDETDYNSIEKKFKGIDVHCRVRHSAAANLNRIIFAGGKSIDLRSRYSTESDESHLFHTLNLRAGQFVADEQNKNPDFKKAYGAYLGIKKISNGFMLCGVSSLAPRKAKFRQLNNAERSESKNSYSIAHSVTSFIEKRKDDFIQAAISQQLGKSGGKPLLVKFANESPPPPTLEQEIFYSYHGMIKAMVSDEYATGGAEYFELALSDDTDKVSSCFPCATFMTANRLPPSSIHLGRGDNWGIPPSQPGSSGQRGLWETEIRKWYAKGIRHIHQKMANDIQGFSIPESVPELFLESLTFEKSFTKRILGTALVRLPLKPT